MCQKDDHYMLVQIIKINNTFLFILLYLLQLVPLITETFLLEVSTNSIF